MDTPLTKLTAERFLEKASEIPVLDVRSPAEYKQGHIPGALNMPLFDDKERAIVGTTYTKSGFDQAFLSGLDFAGPHLSRFVSQAKDLATQGELMLYCWRGGMRSGSMAWLFNYSGINTSTLEGGYKSYRHLIRASFSAGPQLKVIGGMTGSGKTELLHLLEEIGEQILDLEHIANHRGSAFGSLGQKEQPTNEQFENELAMKWLSFDIKKPVWVEDESRSIGKIFIPDPFYLRMKDSPVIFIEVPQQTRSERIAREYGDYAPDILESIILKISRRFGGDKAKKAISYLKENNLVEAISLILEYYDKAYLYDLTKRKKDMISTMSLDSGDLKQTALRLAGK